MTMPELIAIFDNHASEFAKFELVENKLSSRADLHGMMLLDRLDPGRDYILAAAEHDQIWFGADPETVARNATEDDLLVLMRCGVLLADDGDSFSMFV